jgi:flagellin
MNELAVKASNGTNALSDRQTIQDEVDQLLTEIDRVSETTKFNETYLLKGDKDTKTVTVNAQDAGLEGKLTQNTTRATFTMDKLSLGDTIKIGGTEYTIGSKNVIDITNSIANAKAGELITVDGTQYTVVGSAAEKNEDKNMLQIADIEAKVAAGSSVIYKGKTHTVMVDKVDATGATGTDPDGIDDEKATVITAETAYKKIAQELKIASSVGATNTAAVNNTTGGNAPTNGPGAVEADTVYKNDGDKIIFGLDKGKVDRKEGLTFALHVGADADMTNKISVNIDALDTAGLGIQGLNVKDGSGAAATYAIDAIADAVAHVSAQRSLLGAVQNRLEHTINNLDNVVENTTAAESQIRDTEMVKYSNANILSQAGQSMLAQGNQANQGVLSLLG